MNQFGTFYEPVFLYAQNLWNVYIAFLLQPHYSKDYLQHLYKIMIIWHTTKTVVLGFIQKTRLYFSVDPAIVVHGGALFHPKKRLHLFHYSSVDPAIYTWAV